MIPQVDMLQIIIVSVLIFGAYLAYKTWAGGSASAPDTFTTKIFLITRRREIYEQKAENQNNIMLPKKGGYGYLERVKAVVIYRYGRVKTSHNDTLITENSRKREHAYIVRENDPAPLEISNRENGYIGQPVTNEEFLEAKNSNNRTAHTQGLITGSAGDFIAKKMSTAVIISVAVAGGAWVLVLLTKADLI